MEWSHSCFMPSLPMTDGELIEHREDLSLLDPSLPQRAGRAFTKLGFQVPRLEAYRSVPHPRTSKKNAKHEMRVFSEVHPTVDVDKFVKILLNYEPRDQ